MNSKHKAISEARRKYLGNKDYLERRREEQLWLEAGDPAQDAGSHPWKLNYVQMPLEIVYGRGIYIYMSGVKALYVGMTSRGIVRAAHHLENKARRELIDKKGNLFFFRVPPEVRSECIEAYLIFHLRPQLNTQRPSLTLKRIVEQERGFGASILQKLQIRHVLNGR